jgi:hypothetical protein
VRGRWSETAADRQQLIVAAAKDYRKQYPYDRYRRSQRTMARDLEKGYVGREDLEEGYVGRDKKRRPGLQISESTIRRHLRDAGVL